MIGHNMAHALAFIEGCRGWSTYATDRATVNAVKSLARRGLVEVNAYHQFRAVRR